MVSADFYWLAHHDVTGKPRLHYRAVQFGCAAALLIDLISYGYVQIAGGVVAATEAERQPAGDLSRGVLHQITGEAQHGRQHSVSVWLGFLSERAPARIARQLAQEGHLDKKQRRAGLLGGAATVYVPVDSNRAATPWALLVARLNRRDILDGSWLCLAGLVIATGLESFVLDGAPASAFDHLRQQAARVPDQVRDVLLHTHSAVGQAVLSHRT